MCEFNTHINIFHNTQNLMNKGTIKNIYQDNYESAALENIEVIFTVISALLKISLKQARAQRIDQKAHLVRYIWL